MQKGSSRIISAGYYIPKSSVQTAHILEEIKHEIPDLELGLIEQSMGVVEVRHSTTSEKPSDLAVKASRQALSKADINFNEVGFIIYCGVEGDYVEPSTAHAVQNRLRLSGACFDIQNACLGFATGLQIADALIASRMAKYVLVCTGEKLSNLTKAVLSELKRTPDLELFKKKLGFLAVGDAGGAALVGPKEGNSGFKGIHAISHGKLAGLCYYRMKSGSLDGQMVMDKITAQAIRAHKDIYGDCMKALKWTPSKINCLITHQVGKRLFGRLSQIFNIAQEKMTKTYERYGNIATATFPVNYAQALESGKLKPGDNVFCGLSGSGLAICQMGFQV